MSKLKNIVSQLSNDDYKHIYNNLVDNEATKSAYLLKHLREKRLSDKNIMIELDVNVNAFYTLRSRLNQKIEEFLLRQMQSPRTDLLKKVANINEIIFNKKRDIAIATLKKLEKELVDYDLTNELTIAYKALKKLHINNSEYYEYSKKYNKHVAFALAVDKAEELLSEYFKNFGLYLITEDEKLKFGLSAIVSELENVSKLYKSHRLYVYKNCVKIFHTLMIENQESLDTNDEPIEDILKKIETIFDNYYLDSIYFNIKVVFDYLKLLYYNHYKVYKKAENFYESVNTCSSRFLTNYNLYTFPGLFYIFKLERHLRIDETENLYNQCTKELEDIEINYEDTPNTLLFVYYNVLACYYSEKYERGLEILNDLIQKMNLKKFTKAYMETKLLSLLLYRRLHDLDTMTQNINSVQRLIRMMGKDECAHISLFIKVLKTSTNENLDLQTKQRRIQSNLDKINKLKIPYSSPLKYLKMDRYFVGKMIMD